METKAEFETAYWRVLIGNTINQKIYEAKQYSVKLPIGTVERLKLKKVVVNEH